MAEKCVIQELNNKMVDLNDILDLDIMISEYIMSDQISSSQNCSCILNLNIRGMLSKQEKLKSLIRTLESKMNLPIICLCKTWLTKDTAHLVNIPNYTAINNC